MSMVAARLSARCWRRRWRHAWRHAWRALSLGLVQATGAILAALARLGGALLQRFPFFQRHNLLAMNFELLLTNLHDYRFLQGQNI